MTSTSKILCGIILISMPTIEFGGYFILQVLAGQQSELALTTFQEAMFRAGHGHAGILVILSIIAQLLTDHAKLSTTLSWFVRLGFPTAALLVSGGFFAGAIGSAVTTPTNGIFLLYAGVTLLAIVLVVLGVGLIRNGQEKANA